MCVSKLLQLLIRREWKTGRNNCRSIRLLANIQDHWLLCKTCWFYQTTQTGLNQKPQQNRISAPLIDDAKRSTEQTCKTKCKIHRVYSQSKRSIMADDKGKIIKLIQQAHFLFLVKIVIFWTEKVVCESLVSGYKTLEKRNAVTGGTRSAGARVVDPQRSVNWSNPED